MNTYRVALLSSLLALSGIAQAIPAQSNNSSVIELATAEAEKITDAEAFVEEIDLALDVAQEGGYGRLKRGAMPRLESARDRIADLLEGHDNAMELSPEERIELYNAQELITSILKNDDKDRVVCRKEVRTGSRVPTTECLTIAQLEERTRASRYTTNKMQTMGCVPGEGQSCGKIGE